MEQQQDCTGQARQSPSERAMTDIVANLEKWFAGEQPQEVAMAAICQISGPYKMKAEQCG